MFVVIGLGIVALVGAAAVDAVRGIRRRPVPSDPVTTRRVLLVTDESVPLTDLDAALATLSSVGTELRVTGDGVGLRRLAARWAGVPVDSLIVPDDGSTGIVELNPGGAVIVSWNVRR